MWCCCGAPSVTDESGRRGSLIDANEDEDDNTALPLQATPALDDRIISSWSKPMIETPVAKDFPRLVRKFCISDMDGHILLSPSDLPKSLTNQQCMRRVLEVLSDRLHSAQDSADFLAKFDSVFTATSTEEVASLMRSFMALCVENDPVLRLLKWSTQAILAPAACDKQLSFGRKFKFKDMKGSWNVFVEIEDEYIVLTHVKQEEALEKYVPGSAELFPQPQFMFEWELTIVVNKTTLELAATRHIVTWLEFAECASQSTRLGLPKAMSRVGFPVKDCRRVRPWEVDNGEGVMGE